jgi:magnesium chelatase family protein
MRYQGRLSGPLLDRIDLHVQVMALPPAELLQTRAGENTDRIRARCIQARDRALARQGKPNQALGGQEIDTHARPDEAARRFLDTAALRLGWSPRGLHRTLKVARTIADLAGAPQIGLVHMAEAMQYRQTAAGH